MSFVPKTVTTNCVGDRFKNSKKHITWVIELDNQEHTIDLSISVLTNRRRVFFNGDLRYQGFKPIGRAFEYTFSHRRHIILVRSTGNGSDVIVNNLSFNASYSKKLWDRIYGKIENPESKQEEEEDFKHLRSNSPRVQLDDDFLEIGDDVPQYPRLVMDDGKRNSEEVKQNDIELMSFVPKEDHTFDLLSS